MKMLKFAAKRFLVGLLLLETCVKCQNENTLELVHVVSTFVSNHIL